MKHFKGIEIIVNANIDKFKHKGRESEGNWGKKKTTQKGTEGEALPKKKTRDWKKKREKNEKQRLGASSIGQKRMVEKFGSFWRKIEQEEGGSKRICKDLGLAVMSRKKEKKYCTGFSGGDEVRKMGSVTHSVSAGKGMNGVV